MKGSIYFVYLLLCSDETLYCGYTSDIIRRLSEHNRGTGAKYTRSRLPARLVYLETLPDKGSAMKREYVIKQMTRPEKLSLTQLRLYYTPQPPA